MIAKGYEIYNGSPKDIRKHLGSMHIEMPMYVNPVEFLIKVSIKPKDFKHDLTLSEMHVISKNSAISNFNEYERE